MERSLDMPVERLNPLNDYLFFKVMGEKGDEEQLLGFLNAVLKRTDKYRLVSVEILENKTFTAEVIGDKTSILDIRSVLEDGTRVNIEVQLRNLGNMDRRSLFYWSREYSQSLEAGQDYLELPNVVAINIVDFEFLPSGDFHTTFHLWEDRERGLMLTDALEIHFVDMVKFKALREKDIKNDSLHRWLTWFNKDSPPELVKEVVKMDAAIKKAEERVSYVSNDKEALRAYQMRQMALSDYTSGINHARREGMREGEEKKMVEIARNLKSIGDTKEKIAQVTGLFRWKFWRTRPLPPRLSAASPVFWISGRFWKTVPGSILKFSFETWGIWIGGACFTGAGSTPKAWKRGRITLNYRMW
jgi:predicted transposase/invertase (TIGR01784 family)